MQEEAFEMAQAKSVDDALAQLSNGRIFSCGFAGVYLKQIRRKIMKTKYHCIERKKSKDYKFEKKDKSLEYWDFSDLNDYRRHEMIRELIVPRNDISQKKFNSLVKSLWAIPGVDFKLLLFLFFLCLSMFFYVGMVELLMHETLTTDAFEEYTLHHKWGEDLKDKKTWEQWKEDLSEDSSTDVYTWSFFILNALGFTV